MNIVRKKIVIDTSSLIAACIYPDRLPATIFKHALAQFQLVASAKTKHEIYSVLQRPKFDKWQPLDIRMAWVKMYFENIEEYEPTLFFTDCTDPKDNMFLDIAVAADAAIIVCSDEHLLSLHPFKKHGGSIEILTLRGFKEAYLSS